MKYISILFFVLFGLYSLQAQDPIFTNFDNHLSLINPAFVGDIPDSYTMRLGIQNRRQWFDLVNDYYEHTAISLEKTAPICHGFGSNADFSFGGHLIQERFSGARNTPNLTAREISLQSAMRLKIDKKAYVTVGFGVEGLSRRLNTISSLQFGTQYDGLGGFDYNTANAEVNLHANKENLSSRVKLDLGTGVAFVYTGNTFTIKLGSSIKHISRSNLSILENNLDDDARISHLITSNYRIKYSVGKSTFQLFGLFAQQGKGTWQINQGGELSINHSKYFTAIGLGTRLTNSQFYDGNYFTDIYSTIRWRINQTTISIAVDLLRSSFAKVGNDDLGTTIEVGVNYIFNKSNCNNTIKCPEF